MKLKKEKTQFAFQNAFEYVVGDIFYSLNGENVYYLW